MDSATRLILSSVAALAALSWTDPVIAEEEAASGMPQEVIETFTATPSPSGLPRSVQPPGSARSNPFGATPLNAEDLDTGRGGNGVFNENQLKGVVADNSASHLTTGMNVISDGAFSGAVGLPTVIQNSGNNVLIQNSTIVNVQLK